MTREDIKAAYDLASEMRWADAVSFLRKELQLANIKSSFEQVVAAADRCPDSVLAVSLNTLFSVWPAADGAGRNGR